MTTIRIPTPLRPYTNAQAEVPVSGGTVGAVLDDLTARYPSLRQHLYSDSGELRAFVNVFLNDEDIRHIQGADTPVKDQDRLMIVPSIAGG
jgi:molybdopterin converting factor small subunit